MPDISDALRRRHFPTHAAERLASQFLEVRGPRGGSGVLEASGLPDVWKLGAPGGRAIALFRTATVLAAMRKLIGANQRVFDVAPPSAKHPTNGSP